MDLEEAGRPRLGESAARDAVGRVRARIRLASVTAIAVVAIAVPAAAMAATPEPGTPVAVAPGVPGHGRAWELVTPADTTTTTVFFVKGASASGDRIVFVTTGTLPGASNGAGVANNLAERGPSGWTARPLDFPEFDNLGLIDTLVEGPKLYNRDLSASIWTNLLDPPEETVRDIGLFRSEPLGQYSLALDMGPEAVVAGASEDLQRVVFSASKHLLPADAGRVEGRSLYELVGADLRLVDVDEAGLPLSACGSRVPETNSSGTMPGAISTDARRIFFASPSPNTSCAEPSRIYLREGGVTTEISASRCTRPDCLHDRAVDFVGATPDGSSAFLVTAEQLTNDDDDLVSDLYRYDVADGSLSRISAPHPADLSGGGARASRVWPSADGSRVYFNYDGALVPGTPGGLYLADADGVRHVLPPGEPKFQVSRDGRYAAFSTAAPLEPADTDERQDVYRYDAVDSSYQLLSAGGPDGVDEPVEAILGDRYSDEVGAFSTDGGTVFFSTNERLLPGDRNEAYDVYSWEAGDLGLVSAGVGSGPAQYLYAPPDGRTVFFRTSETLLPRDRDGGDKDIYAARIGGGFPEPPAAATCEGEACRPLRGRIERPASRSASAGGRIEIAHLGRKALRRVAVAGSIVLLVEVPTAGRLSVEARARIDGRLRTVGDRREQVERAGPVRLRLRLSAAARGKLARGEQLRLQLQLRLSGLRGSRNASIVVPGAR